MTDDILIRFNNVLVYCGLPVVSADKIEDIGEKHYLETNAESFKNWHYFGVTLENGVRIFETKEPETGSDNFRYYYKVIYPNVIEEKTSIFFCDYRELNRNKLLNIDVMKRYVKYFKKSSEAIAFVNNLVEHNTYNGDVYTSYYIENAKLYSDTKNHEIDCWIHSMYSPTDRKNVCIFKVPKVPGRNFRILRHWNKLQIDDGNFDRWANSVGAEITLDVSTKINFMKCVDTLISMPIQEN